MRYKALVQKKLDEIKNMLHSQSSSISLRRPPEELKNQLESILNKIHEINVLLNTENDSL